MCTKYVLHSCKFIIFLYFFHFCTKKVHKRIASITELYVYKFTELTATHNIQNTLPVSYTHLNNSERNVNEGDNTTAAPEKQQKHLQIDKNKTMKTIMDIRVVNTDSDNGNGRQLITIIPL